MASSKKPLLCFFDNRVTTQMGCPGFLLKTLLKLRNVPKKYLIKIYLRTKHY